MFSINVNHVEKGEIQINTSLSSLITVNNSIEKLPIIFLHKVANQRKRQFCEVGALYKHSFTHLLKRNLHYIDDTNHHERNTEQVHLNGAEKSTKRFVFLRMCFGCLRLIHFNVAFYIKQTGWPLQKWICNIIAHALEYSY